MAQDDTRGDLARGDMSAVKGLAHTTCPRARNRAATLGGFQFAQATVLVRGIPPGYDKEQTLAEILSARLMTIGNGESLSAARVVQCTICQRTTTFVRYAFLLKQ